VAASMGSTMTLTPQQIDNWRRALISKLGPYALIMSVEEIQAIQDSTDAIFNEFNEVVLSNKSEEPENKPCICDPLKNGTTTKLSGAVICNNCHKTRSHA
jgi:hypothetical protein